MTESEWLVSEDPQKMLNHVTGKGESRLLEPAKAVYVYEPPAKNRISDRKLRLFACACHTVSDQKALADMSRWGRFNYANDGEDIDNPSSVAQAWTTEYDYDAPAQVKAAILRDIVGNPFQCWNRETDEHGYVWIMRPAFSGFRLTSSVVAMAQTVYDERRFEDLPILADALEDTGCDEVETLQHCRGKERCPNAFRPHLGYDCAICGNGIRHGWIVLRGPHVRGCWVLDLLLGKE